MNTEPSAPKYKIAYQGLLSRLEAGLYPVGSRLPTEEKLMKTFDVSRVTIRRSLDIMVNDGYLERRQGSGYTVLTLSPPLATCLSSFTDAMLRAGMIPSSRMILIDDYPANAPQSAHLIAELHSQPLTLLKRLRLVDNIPQMLVHTWAPTRFLPDAKPEDFPEHGPNQSILRILGNRFGLDWNAACEDISPAAADEETAGFLQIEPGTPVLLQACTAFDDADKIVFTEEVFRVGKVSFDLTGQSREPRFMRPEGVLQ